MLTVDLTVYGDIFEYFRQKFAPEFAEKNGKWDRGYVDYHAMQSRPAVPRPAFSSAYYVFNIQRKATRWQSVGAEITFWNGKKVKHPTPNVQIVMKAVPDLVTAGTSGHLFVLKDRDPTESQAVYVQDDEHTFMIEQDAAHNWTVKGAEI